MKHVMIALEDREVKALEKTKGKRSWKDLMMSVNLPEIAHFLDGYHWFWEGEHGGPFESVGAAMNNFVDSHPLEE